jgi:hypothetical protein
MAARRRSPSASLTSKAVELAMAVPQVVTHRLAMLSMAGPYPSHRDQREIISMSTEKIAAFYQSLTAVWFQSMRAQMMALYRLPLLMTMPALTNVASMRKSTHTAGIALAEIMVAGITPIHRKAVSNAARLARKRR